MMESGVMAISLQCVNSQTLWPLCNKQGRPSLCGKSEANRVLIFFADSLCKAKRVLIEGQVKVR